jgi:hypothetical protein
MLKTYHGSCHCGAVRIQADIDLQAGTGRCNCTYCAKNRWWGTVVKPSAFKLLAGEGDLVEYGFNTRQARHVFCKHCGGKPFSSGDIPEVGGPYVSINIACLDDVEPAELETLPVQYMDGRANNWWHEPAHKAYL